MDYAGCSPRWVATYTLRTYGGDISVSLLTFTYLSDYLCVNVPELNLLALAFDLSLIHI